MISSNKDSSDFSTNNLDRVAVGSKVRPVDHRVARSRKCDLCFSLSNLALIVASALGFFFMMVLLNDQPLAHDLEYLFTWGFHKQLIFVAVILALAFLVPIFNAISSLFMAKSKAVYTNYTILIVKIVCLSILAILVFIGLIFVAPYIAENGVTNQLDLRFLHHMRERYNNQYSSDFLERIQESYQCCDVVWFRINSDARIPISCYVQRLPMIELHHDTCPIVLGRLISLRCKLIALSLLIILISLISLIVISVCELMGQEYDVAKREDYYRRVDSRKVHQQMEDDVFDNKEEPDSIIDMDAQRDSTSPISNNRPSSRSGKSSYFEDDALINDHFNNRLAALERERDTPLLKDQKFRDFEYDDMPNRNGLPRVHSDRPAPLLTRANFTSIDDHRTHSPTFSETAVPGGSFRGEEDLASGHRRGPPRPTRSPSKSSLKKSPTNGLGNSDDDLEDIDDVQEYHREVSTRRSSMNVRFNIK